tara:strand:+ start:215 stop:406 length:192 start_codon:yes stop_codon:yes gene_type:complete
MNLDDKIDLFIDSLIDVKKRINKSKTKTSIIKYGVKNESSPLSKRNKTVKRINHNKRISIIDR